MSRRDYSAEDMAWACRLANRGYTLEQVIRVLSTKPKGKRPAYSVKYLRMLDERGKEVADAYARRTAEKAVEFVERDPKVRGKADVVFELVRIREAAAGLDWSRSPGARRALEAAFLVADEIGSIRFGLSIRDHALRAGQSFQTVRTARRDLHEAGWLRRIPRTERGRSACFSLKVPPTQSYPNGLTQSLTPGGKTVCPSPSSPLVRLSGLLVHDAFRPAALGDAGWYAVSRTLGSDPDVLRVLDAIALELGTAGSLEADRCRFEQERRKDWPGKPQGRERPRLHHVDVELESTPTRAEVSA